MFTATSRPRPRRSATTPPPSGSRHLREDERRNRDQFLAVLRALDRRTG